MKNYIKLIGTSVVASIIVVLVGFNIYQPKSITTIQQIPGQTTVVRGTSPEFSSQYLQVNGVTQWYYSVPMRAASTTLCSFPYPNGTSTLAYVSWNIMTGTSTAASIDIGTSTTAFSTTTLLVKATSVAANAQGQAIWMSPGGANPAVDTDGTDYVNVMTAGAGAGGYTFGGECQAVFNQL